MATGVEPGLSLPSRMSEPSFHVALLCKETRLQKISHKNFNLLRLIIGLPFFKVNLWLAKIQVLGANGRELKQFLFNGTLEFLPTPEDADVFALYHNNEFILPYSGYSENSPLVIELSELDLNSPFLDVVLKDTISATSSGPCVISCLIEDATGRLRCFNELIYNWKAMLRSFLSNPSDILLLRTGENEYVEVFLSEEEAVQKSHTIASTFNHPEELLFLKSDPRQTKQIKTLVQFKLTGTPPASSGILGGSIIGTVPTTFDTTATHMSFQHELNDVEHSIDFLKKAVRHYSNKLVKDNSYYAPVSPLVQGSGGGKSKLCTTFTGISPSFYISCAEKDPNRAVYPEPNNLSDLIRTAVKTFTDDNDDMKLKGPSNSAVGQVLDLIARCCKFYITRFADEFERVKKTKNLTPSNLAAILKSFQEEFEQSEFISISSADSDYLKMLTLKKPANTTVVTNETVIDYIDALMGDTLNCFRFDSSENTEITANIKLACATLNSLIDKIPFVFFIDEAGILASITTHVEEKPIYKEEKNEKDPAEDHSTQYKYLVDEKLSKKLIPCSGFQVFRRALSYLKQSPRLFFVALGTKTTIQKLSPPIIDNSLRNINRCKEFQPLVLLSYDIWRNQYPLDELELSYAALKNCCTFKFLPSLCQPIFSSYYFNEIAGFAKMKLMNGTAMSEKYYIMAMWMQRAGIASNPNHVLSNTLVANHMATLIAVSPAPSESRSGAVAVRSLIPTEAGHYTIAYPSNPSLALGCREIDRTHGIMRSADFFKVLKENSDAVRINPGKVAESFGAMFSLAAIDYAPNAAHTDLQPKMIEQMKAMTPPKFDSLWERQAYLLEPSMSPKTRTVETFKDYKVVTVAKFLETLLGKKVFDSYQHLLPPDTLKGFVNASHFVPLIRLEKGKTENEEIRKRCTDLPPATTLKSHNDCNVINRNQLKDGMSRQSGFLMPENYTACDLIVPVCLSRELVMTGQNEATVEDSYERETCIGVEETEDGRYMKSRRVSSRPIYTFIAIQVKAGSFDHAEIGGMQARLHFVPCPNHTGSPNVACGRCEHDKSLEEIYNNQISLLYCFKEPADLDDGAYPVGDNFISYRNDCINPTAMLKSLYPHLSSQQCAQMASTASTLKLPPAFPKPLIKHHYRQDANCDAVSLFWDEENDAGSSARQRLLFPPSRKGSASKKPSKATGVRKATAPAKKATTTKRLISKAEFNTSHPRHLSPDGPFGKSRMTCLVLYGWDNWVRLLHDNVQGIEIAKTMTRFAESNPLESIDGDEQLLNVHSTISTALAPSLLGSNNYALKASGKAVIPGADWESEFPTS